MTWALIVIALAGAALLVHEIRGIKSTRELLLRENSWPQFEETFISALQSGLSIGDSFSFANDFEIPQVSKPLGRMIQEIDRGVSVSDAMQLFKKEMKLASTDLFVSIVSLAHKTGGHNLVEALQEHVTAVRYQLAAQGDISARQNAILSVAKLGLLAPWILLGVLCTNEHTRESFNTLAGGLLMLGGFAVSMLAYRLTVSAGRSRTFKRIFEG